MNEAAIDLPHSFPTGISGTNETQSGDTKASAYNSFLLSDILLAIARMNYSATCKDEAPAPEFLELSKIS
jgi:hypothetical protein